MHSDLPLKYIGSVKQLKLTNKGYFYWRRYLTWVQNDVGLVEIVIIHFSFLGGPMNKNEIVQIQTTTCLWQYNRYTESN